MSDLNGEGYGSQHIWKNHGCHQWGTFGGKAKSFWSCDRCNVGFVHFYHDTPDIHEAMKTAGVPNECE